MKEEPTIAVGLVENAESITFQLVHEFTDNYGKRFLPGEYQVTCKAGKLHCSGDSDGDYPSLSFSGVNRESHFRLQVVIGIDFHWQQKQLQTFCGTLRFLVSPDNRVTVINDVPLESYILSVSCSEMSANSPLEFLKAHSIISRSWLLAQLEPRHYSSVQPTGQPDKKNEIIRWYDREAHMEFDVCADDHCQRYQGIGMIASDQVSRAVDDTRGIVLVYNGKPCDARFSKCCGGVTEDYRLAWDEISLPYLIPVFDGPMSSLPNPPLANEQAARNFILNPPAVYCNCGDDGILSMVLNNYDRKTDDFFRWRIRLTPKEITELLKSKLALDLGRIISLKPVERGLSARLKRLHVVGEKGSVTIGKELEIRRALSPTHLYSSAFVIDTEGPTERPDAFTLIGAGWGHGVGLCQIGAAVMSYQGIGYSDILRHYYPGSLLKRIYQ